MQLICLIETLILNQNPKIRHQSLSILAWLAPLLVNSPFFHFTHACQCHSEGPSSAESVEKRSRLVRIRGFNKKTLTRTDWFVFFMEKKSLRPLSCMQVTWKIMCPHFRPFGPLILLDECTWLTHKPDVGNPTTPKRFCIRYPSSRR